ncbi:MAG: acyl-CoA dehydrogenase family protein [Anaerolineae bacterium]
MAHYQLAVAATALGLDQHAVAQGFICHRAQAVWREYCDYKAWATISRRFMRSMLKCCAIKSNMRRGCTSKAKTLAAAALKAKLFGAKAARNGQSHAAHGGYGFSDEYTISQLYRDARSLDLLGGTPQVGRIAVWQEVFADSGVVIKP